MPKLIFKEGDTKDIGFNEAKKIEMFYKAPDAKQKAWLENLQSIIYPDGVWCPHSWEKYTKPDHFGRRFVGRKCNKCNKTEILDLV